MKKTNYVIMFIFVFITIDFGLFKKVFYVS